MQSKATTVKQYLAELPQDRRLAISAVREVILKNLDRDYQEGMQYGMIGYSVPHRIYPAGYHCDPRQPLCFVGLASQKNYMSLYMMSVYDEKGDITRFRQAWEKAGKKLDMGKSCIRFKKLDDLPLEVIGDAIRDMPVKKYIEFYETCIRKMLERPVKGPTKRTSKAAKPAKGTKAVRRTKAVRAAKPQAARARSKAAK